MSTRIFQANSPSERATTALTTAYFMAFWKTPLSSATLSSSLFSVMPSAVKNIGVRKFANSISASPSL